MKSLIVLQTDFTFKEGAVSSMYGVIKTIDRSLEVYDSTHEIPNFDIWSAAYRLYQPLQFWPKGTIFVSVVDPGVGTKRKPCIAHTKNDYYIITPDNGTLTFVDAVYGIESVIEINTDMYRLKGYGTEETTVFHGRDIFAYCAGLLASRKVSYEDFGTPYSVEDIVKFEYTRAYQDDNIYGTCLIGDPNFGNLWTNIPFSWVKEDIDTKVQIIIRNKDTVLFNERVYVYETFGMVAYQDITLYRNEYNDIGIALNQGNFMNTYHVDFGPDIVIEIRRN